MTHDSVQFREFVISGESHKLVAIQMTNQVALSVKKVGDSSYKVNF